MLHRRPAGTGPSIQRPFCVVNGQFRVEWMHFLLGFVRSCFLRFVSRKLQPNVRGDCASTRRDTLHGRSWGRKLQGRQAGGCCRRKSELGGTIARIKITDKSLKVRRKPALDVDQEIGAPALLLPKGKNPKTFQFLSFPFIASQAVENGMRGDPKKF